MPIRPDKENGAIADTLEEELVRLIANGSRRSALPVVCAAAVVAAAAYGKAPDGLVGVWFATVATIVLVRREWFARALDFPQRSAERQLRRIALFAFLTGGSFGAAVVFWPWLGDLERAVETMVIVGLCAASVATNLGYLPTFLTFFGSSAGPLMAAWLLGGSDSHARWIEVALAALIALFGFVLTMLARDSFRLFAASFDARREQQRLNAELRVALGEADAASRAKTRFLASASHDLRQPLHTVSLFGAALMMRPLDARTRQIAEHMHTALQSLGSQLDALLDISKLDAGVVAVQPARFALAPFLAAIEADFAPQASARGLALRVECAGELHCHTDPTLLGRIVRNLVDNAIKYTAAGRVHVGAARDGEAGERIRIDVADTGIGIEAAEQPRVFEEFYQIDNPERDRERGLGLGLSIVARLAKLLALRLELKSQVGRGTSVRITLPAAAASPPLAAVEPAGPATLAGLHVLVIDDEQAVREGMCTLLEAWGCSVDSSADTASAARLAAARRPDIVLADLRLRGGDDGIAAIRSVRRLHPDVAAILISGDTAPQRLREAMDADLRLLHKPVAAALLRQAVREEFEKRSGGTTHASHPERAPA